MSPWKAYFLVLLVTLPALIQFFPQNSGFPLDDAWIYTVFSDNLRETGVWSFNLGEPCAEAPSLAWTWLLSFFPGERVPNFYREILAAYALAVLLAFYPLAGALPLLLKDCLEGSHRFRMGAAALLSALTLSHGFWVFHLYSGMETCAFVSMGVLALVSYRMDRLWMTGMALGFLILLGLEGYLLAMVLLVHRLLTDQGRGPRVIPWNILVSPLSLYAHAGVVASLLHHWTLTRTPLPFDLTEQGLQYRLDWGRPEFESVSVHFVGYLPEWFKRLHNWYWMDHYLPEWGTIALPSGLSVHILSVILDSLVSLGAGVVLIRLFTKGGWGTKAPLSLLAVWTLLHNLFYSLVLPTSGHAGGSQAINFLWPPLLVAIGGQEWLRFLSRLLFGIRPHISRSSISRWGTTFAILLTVIPWFISQGVWNEVLTAGIDRINGLHLLAGIWSKKNLEPDSRVIASDSGAYKMASRLYILDPSGRLEGGPMISDRKLGVSEFYRKGEATHLFQILDRDEPDPTLEARWKINLEKVYEARLHEEIGFDLEACQNTGSRCAIYRIDYLEEEAR